MTLSLRLPAKPRRPALPSASPAAGRESKGARRVAEPPLDAAAGFHWRATFGCLARSPSANAGPWHPVLADAADQQPKQAIPPNQTFARLIDPQPAVVRDVFASAEQCSASASAVTHGRMCMNRQRSSARGWGG